MLSRRQIVAGAAIAPAVGLPALPCLDPVRQGANRIAGLADALLKLPLSVEQRRWAETIQSLAARVSPSATDDDGRERRETLSPLMTYSEFLGLHHPANSPVSVLTKELTAAIRRTDEHLSAFTRLRD